MKKRLAGLLLVLSLAFLAVPETAFGQCRSNNNFGQVVRRGRNGVRVGNFGLNLFEGPGILNYEEKHQWMPGVGGAATVIGIGAGAGAATGALTGQGSKKSTFIGAAIGAGAATGLWLYKNRTERHRIF
ncbi:MAG TPA: hypothetical protein VFV34_09015 [Blastocatellia bacterium]|nr:hypothetical protein [Blastocatellia bacterium]